ncbi:MAG: 3-dehydroquinate synthase [Lachnospiraceae bacterium]|nr:3-dehydroquinate synthase [Lachnospiraceae bacterium]
MKKITVNYQEKPCYDIVITDSFRGLGAKIKSLNLLSTRVCIVVDKNVDPLYGDKVEKVFLNLGFKCSYFIIEAGEEYKTLATVRDLYDFLISERFSRDDLLIALGGGVVGDLCGFTAATFLRGISFIQIPTTLLSQTDSSIGGKTGVDFDGYKNMVGAFHMPRLVYINTATLKTLPGREFASGIAEVMKYGLIKDESFYEWLITNIEGINAQDKDILLELIEHSLMIKKAIVEQDPHEKGIRAILNFGHTVGHALEKAADFSLLHGECVALGIIAASFISWKKGYLKMEEYYEIRDMFVPFNLPILLNELKPKEVLAFIKSDKKNAGDGLKYILLEKVGKAFIDKSVTDEEILMALEELQWKED